MNITIKERKFSFRSTYDIQTPNGTYSAQRKVLSFLPRLKVFDRDMRIVANIQGRWSPFREKYNFAFSDGRTYKFGCEKIWKGVYLCRGDGELLQMYRHRGLNYSVFQNDAQIAAFTKNRIVIGKGNEYDVRLKANANQLVIVCMVLALNTSENDDEDSSVTVNLGSLGPQERPYDASWEPS